MASLEFIRQQVILQNDLKLQEFRRLDAIKANELNMAFEAEKEDFLCSNPPMGLEDHDVSTESAPAFSPSLE